MLVVFFFSPPSAAAAAASSESSAKQGRSHNSPLEIIRWYHGWNYKYRVLERQLNFVLHFVRTTPALKFWYWRFRAVADLSFSIDMLHTLCCCPLHLYLLTIMETYPFSRLFFVFVRRLKAAAASRLHLLLSTRQHIIPQIENFEWASPSSLLLLLLLSILSKTRWCFLKKASSLPSSSSKEEHHLLLLLPHGFFRFTSNASSALQTWQLMTYVK